MIVGTAKATGYVGTRDSRGARIALVASLLLVLATSALGYFLTYGWPASFGGSSPGDTEQPQRSAVELARELAVMPEQLTPEASQMMTLDPADAIQRNAAIPLAGGQFESARPLTLAAAGLTDWSRALNCMTTAIYYEAAREPEDGQRAVAQVILNRVRHPLYPKTVCGVVYQGSERATGCQFTFTCDGALARKPVAALWERARKIAASSLLGNVYAPVGWATNYHANYVLPYWAPRLLKTATVGAHIFYRLPSGVGSFGGSYRGSEPDIAALRAETLASEAPVDPGVTVGVDVADRPVLTSESQGLARAPLGESGARWVIGSDGEAGRAGAAPAATPRIVAIRPAELVERPAPVAAE